MNEKSLFLQLTGDMPLFRVVDFLIENKGMDYTKKDIAEGAGISKASLFNYWPELEKQNIVRVTRRFGKTKLYTLNTESPVTKKLLELESVLIRQTMVKAMKKELIVGA